MEEERSLRYYMERYPRITSHIIAESLGYATPTRAASILKDAAEGKENWCEWIFSCYNRNPRKAVENAIRSKHHHKGYMAEYSLAKKLVARALETGEEPVFGSWF